MNQPIYLIDSTLREGDQSYGFNPTQDVKQEIAKGLHRLGCDIIELGHPVVSDSIYQTAKQIMADNPSVNGLVHSLLREKEIELAKQVGAKCIGFFITINPDAIEHKYGNRFEDLLQQIPVCIQTAKQLGLYVRFTCEDASRTPLELLIPFYKMLLDHQVDMLGFADTTGSLLPVDAKHIFNTLRTTFPQTLLHFHGHNDRGVALANALEAIHAGWNSFDASVLGLGERGGIVPLTEAAIVLSESFGKTLNLQECSHLECIVTKNLDKEKYFQRRFAHKAGLHNLSVFKQPETYESVSPAALGANRIGVVSKYCGEKAVAAIAESMGMSLPKQKVKTILHAIKNGNTELSNQDEIYQFFELSN